MASLIDGLANSKREIRFWRCADELSQARDVAADIERLIGSRRVEPARIAVMVSSLESEGPPVAGALTERAIPHRLLGPRALFWREEARDVLAWMRVLLDPGDSPAAMRVLARPPVQLRHVELARVVQIARRRRLDMVAALRAGLEAPEIPPEARERIARFLAAHEQLRGALESLPADRFLEAVLGHVARPAEDPLASDEELAQRRETLTRLGELLGEVAARAPGASTREIAARVVALAEGGGPEPEGAGEGEQPAAGAHGAVRVMSARQAQVSEFDHLYMLGLQSPGAGAQDEGQLQLAAARARDGLVIAYPARCADGRERQPSPLAEDARIALGAEWEERGEQRLAPDELLRGALAAMRAELLEGVSRIGGRLGELRLDTDLDISHGVVRYLELVKLAALLERPEGQSIADALADVNARLLAAATPLQREILETSTLDEALLAAERGGGEGAAGIQAASLLGGLPREERSLDPFLPRRAGGLMLSASDVATYRSCPLRYKFGRVLRVPSEVTLGQRFGIVVHQVLERYHASGGQTVEELLELLDGCWRRGGLSEGSDLRELREKARDALRRYHESLREQPGEPVWFERSFAFRLGPHHVRGRVDRVDRLPDGSYELIDYKTSRPKSEAELRDDLQLSLYALAASESWGLEPSRLSYYYVLDSSKVPVSRERLDAGAVRDAVLAVGEAILAGRFEPTPSPAACGLCDYRIICPAAAR